jgi:23S rRNA (pseudouridine1915-N3)-methyltransferase
MIIQLVAVGEKMPGWVQTAYREYARRLTADVRLSLTEIAPGRRHKSASVRKAMLDEGERQVAAIGRGTLVIALEVEGQPWSTGDLARQMRNWLGQGRNVDLLVGGPDGLSEAARARADQQWSLSPLTLPHPLVRVVLAEQLYRAWSMLHGHPYHRA